MRKALLASLMKRRKGRNLYVESCYKHEAMGRGGGEQQRVEQSELSAADGAVRQPCEIISRYP